jgi:geranylgeranyl reductase family protein
LRAEAAVVGGGPAGLITARELANRGVDVKVYEEHHVIGEPNHCAGILSVEGLDRLNIRPLSDFVQHEVTSGTAFSPDKTGLRITGSRIRAYIVDRSEFDRHLAEAALDVGVEIETGKRVVKLVRGKGSVSGVQGKDFRTISDVVVDCEGATGFLARSIMLPTPSEGVLNGVNVEVSGVKVEENMVEVWFGEELAPDFFAWVAPTGEASARCGLACSKGDSLIRLEGFLRERFRRYESGGPRRWPVLTGGPVSKTYASGLLLVGDVAGQTKPTTGGGVIFGGLCAMEAVATIMDAYETGDFGDLSSYERTWRSRLGKEFLSMLRLRRMMNKVSDDRMDRLFRSLKNAGLEEALEDLIERGDMDMQSGVLEEVLSHRGVMRMAVSSLGRMVLSELGDLFNL